MKNVFLRWQDTTPSTAAIKIPFVVNQLFKIGVGFSGKEVKVAINGQAAAKFPFNQKDNEDFKIIRALEILKQQPLQMEAQAVDFLRVADADWTEFERFTKL